VNAFLPAHGYSRRVPRKHTRPFYKGLSLTQWSVIQAVHSHEIEECYVSTDDNEVADQVEAVGGKVIWRDYEQRPDDTAGVPLYHAVKQVPEAFSPAWGNLLATSPLRPPDLIDRIVRKWRETEPETCQVIGEQEESMLCLKTTAGYVMPFIFKRGPWTTATHSTSVIRQDWWIVQHERSMAQGMDKDSQIQERFYEGSPPVTPYPYIEVPWWMCTEPDTEDDFEVCAVLMGHLLQWRGVEVYEEYKG